MTIPPPKVDRYQPPPPRPIVLADPNDPELIREIRARGMMLGLRDGDEGFEIKPAPGFNLPQHQGGPDQRDEGFSIR